MAHIHLLLQARMAHAPAALVLALQSARILLGLLGLGALGGRTAQVVRDPGLVVVLVNTAGGTGGLVARQRLGDIDDLALLDGTRSLLSLGEEGLNPGLVDEVEGATEDAGQEEVQEDAVCVKVSSWDIESLRKFRDLETYIWGSKMLVGGSTMLARPL